MMKQSRKTLKQRLSFIFCCVFVVITFSFAQDSSDAVVLKPRVAKYSYDAIPKDPLASAFFSATIPGTGQIYNKEYLRGIITGVGFYTSAFVANQMLERWQEMNTDTFLIREAYPTDGVHIEHQVTAMKPDDEQVGLPTKEKAILGSSLLGAGFFYVWGIIDSYNGAKRYNKNLLATAMQKVKVEMAFVSKEEIRLKVDLKHRF